MSIDTYQNAINQIVPHYQVKGFTHQSLELLDTRWGVSFTYQAYGFVKNLKEKPNHVFWSATRGNVTAVPEGENAFRLEAQIRINELAENLYVVDYSKESGIVTLRDTISGVETKHKLNSYLGNLKRGRTSTDFEKKDPYKRASAALEKVAPGRFEVVSVDKGTITIKELTTGSVFRQKQSYIVSQLKKDPNHIFGRSAEEILEKRKDTNLAKLGVEFPLQSEEIYAKMKKTLENNWGVDNISKTEYYRDKYTTTCLDRYGVEIPMQNPVIRDRAIEKSKDKYDGVHHTQHPDIKARIKATNLNRYGVETPLKSPEVKAKIKETLVRERGVDNAQKDPKVKEKARKTRIEKGITQTIDGMTLREKSEQIGSAYSFVQRLVGKLGVEGARPFIDAYTPGGSSLTKFGSDLFADYPHLLDRGLPGSPYRPDLRFEAQKVIVELDGLYWHSEASLNATWKPDEFYHAKKLKTYEDLGYRALFFRSDELYTKSEIVRSIVQNALRINPHKVNARSCTVQEIDPAFFSTTHLMGRGSGRCYGLLHEGVVVAGIQVKWVKKESNLLDVSRFSTRNGTSVVGGWSKLISHVLKTEDPSIVQTFIDRRYGTGRHLAAQGWEFIREEPSFRWTDGISSFHRMKFPGSTGYEHGLFKIWDCGQARWLLKNK